MSSLSIIEPEGSAGILAALSAQREMGFVA